MYSVRMISLGLICVLMQAQGTQASPEGLVIQDVKPGKGEAAKLMDVVQVHYTGTLLDGKKFDSSRDRNEPFQFQLGVGMVIKGWDMGVLGMKPKGERNLTIPSPLAYGATGAGDDIPPNATLKFNSELVKVVPAAKITILKEGTGDGLKIGQAVSCKLSLKVEGKSEELGDPNQESALMINPRMLPGINQALLGIKVGEKRKAILNSDLAFGESGLPPRDTDEQKKGSVIPGKATVVLEIEAVKFVK